LSAWNPGVKGVLSRARGKQGVGDRLRVVVATVVARIADFLKLAIAAVSGLRLAVERAGWP